MILQFLKPNVFSHNLMILGDDYHLEIVLKHCNLDGLFTELSNAITNLVLRSLFRSNCGEEL